MPKNGRQRRLIQGSITSSTSHKNWTPRTAASCGRCRKALTARSTTDPNSRAMRSGVIQAGSRRVERAMGPGTWAGMPELIVAPLTTRDTLPRLPGNGAIALRPLSTALFLVSRRRLIRAGSPPGR
jgi:hypothetical protein